MYGAMSAIRLMGIVVAGAVALAMLLGGVRPEGRAAGVLTTSDGDTVDVTHQARSGGLRFDPAVVPEDRAWPTAAIARGRPEAARLIAEVDGLVTVGTYSGPGPTLGVTSRRPTGFRGDLDVRPAH